MVLHPWWISIAPALCSKLIPSVTEKSTIFAKELSFPQKALTDDAFFNRTGLEGVGVFGPD